MKRNELNEMKNRFIKKSYIRSANKPFTLKNVQCPFYAHKIFSELNFFSFVCHFPIPSIEWTLIVYCF